MCAFARHGLLLSLLLFAAAAPAAGQITVVGGGDQKITLSGIVQPQYLVLESPGVQANDDLLFRRLFTQVAVEVNPRWAGAIQLDFGKSEVSVKNAYVQYTGWRDRGLLLTVGNQKPPFSRSFTTSGIKRTLAERPFTGDVHYGTLNRFLGVRLDGWTHDHHVQWAAALGAAIHRRAKPGSRSTHRRTATGPATRAPRSWGGSNGIRSGRRRPSRATSTRPRGARSSASPPTAGGTTAIARRGPPRIFGSSDGLELSGGLRGHGVSMDAEFEPVHARARADVGAGGVFDGRQARLRKGSVEGSYMVVNHRLELAAGVDVLGAGAWARAWRRTSIGANWSCTSAPSSCR